MDETPQKIHILKQWNHYYESHYILRAYRDRNHLELDLDYELDKLCKLSKDDPELFESETGYSSKYFSDDDKETMERILRNLFHIEKVELY